MQISEFGQIPRQLWPNEPHPHRLSKADVEAYEKRQAKVDIDDSARTVDVLAPLSTTASSQELDQTPQSPPPDAVERRYSVGRLLEKSHMASYRDLRAL